MTYEEYWNDTKRYHILLELRTIFYEEFGLTPLSYISQESDKIAKIQR